MTRRAVLVGLAAIAAVAGCGESVRASIDGADATPPNADSSSRAADGAPQSIDSLANATCSEVTGSASRPPELCVASGFRCSDGTTRFSLCRATTQRCECTIVGGATFECPATTGFTPPACENIRNCCWR